MANITLPSEIVDACKYVFSAIAGSTIMAAFVKWLWGRAISQFNEEANSKHLELTNALKAQNINFDNTIKLLQSEWQRDIKELREGQVAIFKELKEGSDRFKSIERDINETQTDIGEKMGTLAEKSSAYREQAHKDFVTKDQIEGEIIKVTSKYCKDNCRGK